MPISKAGKKIKTNLEKQYGKKKGEQVFYAMENKGEIPGMKKKGYAVGGEIPSARARRTRERIEEKKSEKEMKSERPSRVRAERPKRPTRTGMFGNRDDSASNRPILKRKEDAPTTRPTSSARQRLDEIRADRKARRTEDRSRVSRPDSGPNSRGGNRIGMPGSNSRPTRRGSGRRQPAPSMTSTPIGPTRRPTNPTTSRPAGSLAPAAGGNAIDVVNRQKRKAGNTAPFTSTVDQAFGDMGFNKGGMAKKKGYAKGGLTKSTGTLNTGIKRAGK